jgi:hypothetical protein
MEDSRMHSTPNKHNMDSTLSSNNTNSHNTINRDSMASMLSRGNTGSNTPSRDSTDNTVSPIRTTNTDVDLMPIIIIDSFSILLYPPVVG